MQQSLIIQKQQKEIAELKAKLKTKQQIKKKRSYSSSSYAKPKKNIKLKKVEDNNYTHAYMYPDDKKKTPVKVASVSSNVAMNKTECIAMIGEEKFNRYTQMFGSEAAAIKRCVMIKAMKK